MNLKTITTTAALLVCSNVFMTFAWYAHLRNLRARPLLIAFLWAGLCLMGAVYFIFRPSRAGFLPTTSRTVGEMSSEVPRRAAASQWRRSDAAFALVKGEKLP